MLLPGLILLVVGLFLLFKSFSAFQKRDKRFKKGVRYQGNKKAIVYLVISGVFIYVSIKFLMV